MSVDHPTTVWLPVPRYEGFYEAANDGNVRRVGRATGAQAGRIKRPTPHPCGYLSIILCKKQKDATFLVHRVIAETFLGPIPAGYEVNHKNGIKTDNRVENLEYVTSKQNKAHAREIGLADQRGEANPQSLLTREQVVQIRAEYQPKVCGYKRLGKRYGVHWGTVRNVIKGYTWNF